MNARMERVELRIPSDPAAMSRLQGRFLRRVRQCRYDDAVEFALVLAFAEALANAHHHGNRRNSAKHILIRYCLCAERAEIEVMDEGNGFDPGVVVDPRALANLERSHGRGLLLMRTLLDEVRFSHNGRCIHLIKLTHDRGVRNGAAA